ncbi:MAG: hypothetical protein Q9222_003570 [Ikaeria aurantiellina]
MLYQKTLKRQLIGESAQSTTTNSSQTNGSLKANETHSITGSNKFDGFMRYLKRRIWQPSPRDEIKQSASIGKIYNLMRYDCYEVAQRFWEFQSLVRVPLSLILSIVLVWKLIGWPCFFGVVTVIVAQSVNALITRILLRYERERRSVTDSKLKKVTQYVAAIRHLRWYGWEDHWQERILQSRQQELRLFVITGLWRAMIGVTNYLATGLFPVAAFYAYTALAGQPLRVDVAFPALELFSMLESSLRDVPTLITTLLNAKIAVGRIVDFMSEPDKDDTMTRSSIVGKPQIELQNASFSWPGVPDKVLNDITLRFPVGLTVVCGKVAAGKTALLQALLGELEWRGGKVILPDDTVGYCAQTPWLQSMSIRDNILFISPYEEARYKKVLKACALTQDLATFKHGDLTNIGENGIGLSGGQKARVALARAVYSHAKILYLDDPLSALDHQTAEFIVRHCLCGSLTEGRTVILVTHRVTLCQHLAQQVVEVVDGAAYVLSTDTVPSDESPVVMATNDANELKKGNQEESDDGTVPDKFIEDEKRSHGGIRAAVYWEYIKAGKIRWWIVLIVVIALSRLLNVAKLWFLKKWGESYDRPREIVAFGLLDDLPSPEVDIRPWLLGFFLLAIVQALVFLSSLCVMIVIVYHTGRQMFRDVINRVSHATFRFYDVTPIGRLMNRMISDIGTVDDGLSEPLDVQLRRASRRFDNSPRFVIRKRGDGLQLINVAFRAQTSFQDRIITVTDAFQQMDHFYWSLQAWLMYRLDGLSAFSTFLLTLLALYTGVSPGLTAFVLISASNFVLATHMLCKQYGSLQMDFVSVERVVELLHLEQELPGAIDPPAWWPTYSGEIIFENVTIRYAPHLNPSLTRISFRIPAGSTTALLGRTGSGKSTLALSLLAIMHPESGHILIDNIDISKVDTKALRNRITFLAQDPVLFPGSMHQNLDPLSEHPSSDCASVLHRIGGSTYNWTLDTEIEAGGKNLSQGQRQLVGLARAILRRSSVVILDEATASIDTETAIAIQQILREELRQSTVITIAHRLEAVKDADFFVRLEEGRVTEWGPAENGSGSGTDATAGKGGSAEANV